MKHQEGSALKCGRLSNLQQNTLLILCFLVFSATGRAQLAQLNDLPSNRITPAGWVKEFLERQERGLTGHPEESGFPFDTGMWTERMNYKDREFTGGTGWWPYEQTAYYLDGALRCAYLNESDKLRQKVVENIAYVLARADEKGVLHAGDVVDDWWPLAVFMRMLFEQYENTQDADLLAAMEKHYRTTYAREESFRIPAGGGFAVRSVLHVEHLAGLYAITGDKWYLATAEKLYGKFEDRTSGTAGGAAMLSASGMGKGAAPAGHAVTYHEFLKLPAILYYHTGKERYKKAVYEAYRQLEDRHELADGLSSGVEGLQGNATDMAHEVCNVTDFNWTSGWALLATQDVYFADKMEKVIYNAGFSSVTADFRAHQYYSAPNMPIATDMSSFYNDQTNWGFNGKGRLCYRPGHDTECCTGNVHRMFPTFLNRAILADRRAAKIVFYLPGSFDVPMGEESLNLTQITNYPFEHSVRLKINGSPKKEIALGLRIPGWADGYVIRLNGKEVRRGNQNEFFEEIRGRFSGGDEIEIAFSTKPKIDRRRGVAVNYGPLVFSCPIAARTKLTTEDSGGKSSKEFPAYQLFPQEHRNWAFALPTDLSGDDIGVLRSQPQNVYPWGYGQSPVKLSVRARAVANWRFRDNVSVAEIPTDVELKDEPETRLLLEPMGSTLLRITEFPTAKF